MIDRHNGFTSFRGLAREVPAWSSGVAAWRGTSRVSDPYKPQVGSRECRSRAKEDIDRRGGAVGPPGDAYFARKLRLRVHCRLEPPTDAEDDGSKTIRRRCTGPTVLKLPGARANFED